MFPARNALSWRLVISVALIALLFAAKSDAQSEAPVRADVVIYGGTSAGVVAAVQVARMGKTAVLLEPSRHVGGLTTGGLGYTDTGNKSVIGGLSREFYQRVRREYDREESWKYEKPQQFKGYRAGENAIWAFEPHVAERVMEAMLREVATRVTVVRQARLDRAKGVSVDEQRISAIRLKDGRRFQAAYFVDATYEGDLMAAAGVTYTIGRESNAKYGELLNGVQKKRNTHNHRFVVPVDPYHKPGDRSSGLVPNVHDEPLGPDGSGDRRVQAYCFRMCMTRVPENRVPFPKPIGYDEREYELLFRNFEAGDLRLPLSIRYVPNGKTDTNNNGAFSTDYLGMSDAYPEASDEEREKIVAQHARYQQGLMWTLTHHPRVPQVIRDEMAAWGLAKDEFQDNGHWPHAIYVREARRMVSDYVVTEHDCRRNRVASDSVGLGSYNMDSHNVQRYVTADGTVQNEGDIQVSPGGPYAVSYRSIIPRRGECENLLVPVCVSASHIAYGSIRMEPVFMILGQSAATAAVLALEAGGQAVQDVDYQRLRARLLSDGQVLDVDLKRYPPKRILSALTLPGTVVDDHEAQFSGPWRESQSVGPYIGDGYRAVEGGPESTATALYEFKLRPGWYDVRLSYSAHPNRATRVEVEVHAADGRKTVYLNQRQTPPIDSLLTPLGRFRSDGDQPLRVIVRARGADGYVIADAVQCVAAANKQK